MNWFTENIVQIISILFGAGGIGYATFNKILERGKYKQEVRNATVSTDIHSDEFWKNRYDVLNAEMQNKDAWWKERYDNLYDELQAERKMSNEIIRNFRAELNEIQKDYEQQKKSDREKYNDLMEQYRVYQQEVEARNQEQIKRISQLERLVAEYEKKLSVNNYKPNK